MGTFYVVRHAKSGSRSHWSGDDRLRPLTKKGQNQADALVSILEPFPIAAIYSSPFLRCVQTVQPLAKARKLPLKQTPALGEGKGLAGAMQFIGDPKLKRAVLCTHGDIMWELVDELVKRKIVKPGEGGYDKGAMWVVDVKDGSFEGARYIPAP
ncbi:MAG TPA: phosphoglycerate mutase family protein [Candidatus Eisenbacteria bacterium]|nr:phosphoglycerate mutase family protein [Candidatus Eisenbacteria bacterium]